MNLSNFQNKKKFAYFKTKNRNEQLFRRKYTRTRSWFCRNKILQAMVNNNNDSVDVLNTLDLYSTFFS